jgi:phosphoglycolate phosphatase
MTQNLRLVMFDMDGTLIDSQDLIVEAMTAAFAQMGQSAPSRQKVLSIVGLSLDRAVATLMPELTDAEVAEGAALYKQNFIRLRAEKGGEAAAPLYPGVRQVLDALAGDDFLLMGVATGKARRGLDHAYAAHDLGRYFVTHQTADDHPSKPHPSMLTTALGETGVEARRAVMIGDTSFDMEMARAAGFHAVGVSWGYHPRERLGAAHEIIDDIRALPGVLDRIWRQGA